MVLEGHLSSHVFSGVHSNIIEHECEKILISKLISKSINIKHSKEGIFYSLSVSNV